MNGFGDPAGEHWLSLYAMHVFTVKLGRKKMRLDLTGPDGRTKWESPNDFVKLFSMVVDLPIRYYMIYDDFSVGDPDSNYRLNLGGLVEGNAPDFFRFVISE